MSSTNPSTHPSTLEDPATVSHRAQGQEEHIGKTLLARLCSNHNLPALEDIWINRAISSPCIHMRIEGADPLASRGVMDRNTDGVYIHQYLLCALSQYFKGMLEGAGSGIFMEGKSRILNLSASDMSQECLEAFAHWVYTQDLSKQRGKWLKLKARSAPDPDSTTASVSEQDEDKWMTAIDAIETVEEQETFIISNQLYFDCHYRLLMELYTFADRMLCEALSNAVIDEVIYISETHNIIPGYSEVLQLWSEEWVSDEQAIKEIAAPFNMEYTHGHGRGLKGLVLDLYAFASRAQKLLLEEVEPWPERFLREVVVSAARRARRRPARKCLAKGTPNLSKIFEDQDTAWPCLKGLSEPPNQEEMKNARCSFYHIHRR